MLITRSNLLTLIQKYFLSIGIGSEAIDLFSSTNFDKGIVLRLPDVCLLPGNKSATSRSKQTHIHVTGDYRYFFFDKQDIENVTTSSEDKEQSVAVSQTNINNLCNRFTKQRYSSVDSVDSYTYTKVAYRANQDVQVQISKIRRDGSEFIALRRGLYKHDLLVFLKYKDQDKFYAIGIPSEFCDEDIELPDGCLYRLESPGNISIKTALQEVESHVDAESTIRNSNDISDGIYQQLVNDASADDTAIEAYEPQEYIPQSKENSLSSKRPPTNPGLGKSVIKNAQYKCVFSTEDNPHNTFMKPNGKPYMEVHHLIPLEQQGSFRNKLDTRANLVPVCPLCHKKIHYGQKKEVDEMLSELFTKQSTLLSRSGLDVTEDDLKSFY